MRNGLKTTLVPLILAAAGASDAAAGVRQYQLPGESAAYRAAPSLETVQNNCLACHSADYVTTQPRGLGVKFWEAEVTKMRTSYGAPISDEDARTIIHYLSNAY